jgi:hypothetical protein
MVKDCELRRFLPGSHPGEPSRIVCGAGDFVLARGNPPVNGEWEAICNSCPIPDQLATDRWACLHLRPLKIARDSPKKDRDFQEYYACHWFYRLYRNGPPRSMAPCHGCPYWFPRPPVADMEPAGYWKDQAEVLAAIRAMTQREEGSAAGSTPKESG